MITNRDVLKAMMDKKPSLFLEVLDDIYICGCNYGLLLAEDRGAVDQGPIFDEDWLESDWDKMLFRECDVKYLFGEENVAKKITIGLFE